MPERIVITGAGVVSAIGCGQAETLSALREKRSGIGPVKYLETSLRDFPVGEAPLSNAELSARTGAPETWPRTTLLSILALQEALEQAKIVEGITLPDSLMLVSGTTVGGMDLSEKLYPAYSPWHSCGASTDLAAQFLGFSHATTLSTACSSAANAFIYAANLIRCGLAQRVVAGGAESLSDYHLNGFNSLMILDREWCRPFNASRAGLNLGEGAAFLVLETEESALERGAKPIAVLSGWGNACDAFHQTASSENGEGAFLAMSQALNRAGLKPSDIDYVNAHGTGTPNNDASESTALRRIFGDSLPPVSSTKPFTGHTTSASGSIEAVFCLLALQHGFLPPELNWKEADPACVTPYRSFGLRPQDDKCHSEQSEESLRHILSNAFGFGGNDSSIILSRV
ncbi:MAG: beta-ketoacyl-[acyl-carrier-protein] synthase family protein [Bacteroidales bacterium]|nr:beta-ketoacyl-[acyl-carrier-protein] synthase family protein [Bacteroidales bacterium]